MARTTLHLVSYQSFDECSGSEREWAFGANLEGMTRLRRFRRVVDSLLPSGWVVERWIQEWSLLRAYVGVEVIASMTFGGCHQLHSGES